jgi:hypothetical protein
MMWIDMTPHDVVSICVALVAFGVGISSLEVLASWRHYRRGGVLDCSMLEIDSWVLRHFPRVLFTAPCVYITATLRFLAVCPLMFPLALSPIRAACALLALVGLGIQTAFSRSGTDGADQMAKMVLAAGAGVYLLPSSRAIAEWGIAFIVAQASLAYLVSGTIKFISPNWRSGQALAAIMCTRLFGRARVGRWLTTHRKFSAAVSWAVMIWECLFPLVILAPPRIMALMLAVGVLFHVTGAFVMGLNTFFWSFVGTYPAIVFANVAINRS